MQTTTVINGKWVEWVLCEIPVKPLTKADLISRGFDGRMFHGESIPKGRQSKRTGLFVRSAATGKYECLMQSR